MELSNKRFAKGVFLSCNLARALFLVSNDKDLAHARDYHQKPNNRTLHAPPLYHASDPQERVLLTEKSTTYISEPYSDRFYLGVCDMKQMIYRGWAEKQIHFFSEPKLQKAQLLLLTRYN